MLQHLRNNNGDPSVAFSLDGIETLNKNIINLNKGRFHHPIYKFRWYEPSQSKFPIGEGVKSSKFVEAADGTNLYFAIYVDGKGKRVFETIPLNTVIERLKKGMTPVPEINQSGDKLLFHLSPNDLVYVPTEAEMREGELSLQTSRIYKMVSAGTYQCQFVPVNVASVIVNKIEFTSQNKMERAVTGEMIKSVAIPIRTGRLGNVTYIGKEFLPKAVK